MKSLYLHPVAFKFQLSDLTLFSVSLPLQVRVERLIDQRSPVERPEPPTEDLIEDSQGFLSRSLPVAAELPVISRAGKYICYAPLQYLHCYIDFDRSFEDYESKFSSKTRSTIKRKIKKYADHCGGSIPWKTYTTPGEMQEFFKYARAVSKKTYQEKLLDAGIPESEDFIRQAESLAAEQRLRAYILFDGERPVSYLYCPAHDGVLMYAYLGYDPDYIRMSVGTVLQWLAVEQLFREGCFRYFDFTEGESVHKRLFSTHQKRSSHVFFIRKTLRNVMLIYSHFYMDRFSRFLGETFERLRLKSKIKRLLRHGRQGEVIADLMKTLVKSLYHTLLGDYSLYYIYTWPVEQITPLSSERSTSFEVRTVDESGVRSCAEPLIREQVGYTGPGSHAYACYEGERVVGVCFYWFGDRYRKRNFWPLADKEAKLVQIISLPEVRGRGVASTLILASCRDITKKGFSRIYARIWYSNKPSLSAFERAGWTRAALIIEINPLRRVRPIRIRLNYRSYASPTPSFPGWSKP